MSARVRQSSASFERLWVDESVELAASPMEIHALLSDLDRWPTWVPGLRALRRVGRKPLRVDSRFGMLLSMRPLPTFWVPCQLYALRPDFIEWGGRGPWAAIRHRFELTPLPSGKTRVRHVEYSTNWLAFILIPFEGVFRRHDERWTKALSAQFAPGAALPAQPAAA